MAESSAADHYQKTAARLSITRSLPVDLFRPPNMNAILRYLRLDSISFIEANDLAETWEQMGESLLVSLDLHEAIKRACCLPVPLPECLLNRISMLTEKDAGVLLQRLQLDLLSPISRLHFVDISLELAPKYEFAVDFADKQIIHLLSEQADKEFNLMLAICSFSYREFDNLKVENTEWPTQLLTAWIHSVKLANLLLRYSFNYSELADWISLLSPMPLQNFFLRNWHANRDLAWHANTSFTEIIFVGLARVLTRHEQCHDKLKPLDEFRDRIKSVHTSLLINPRDIFLLHNPYLFTDDLECLWGGERSKLFKILLPPEIAHQFSESSYSASIDEELANLNENPYYENSWMLLHCIARNARLDKNRAEKLDLVLEKLNLTELLKQYPMQLRIILDILIPNVNFIDKIEEFLLSWALRLDFTDTTESTSDLIEADAQEEISMTQVVEWAFQLAVRKSEDEEINDFEFARLLQGLMAKSKRFSAWINKPLLLLSRHISYNHHHELHRLVLCARSRPEAPSR